MRAWCWLFVIALLISASAQAQTETIDDAAAEAAASALLQADLPPRDRIALAAQLIGVREIVRPPITPRQHQIGETDTFSIVNTSTRGFRRLTAQVRALGDHMVVWVEEGSLLMVDDEAQALVDAFDNYIYDSVRALWGSEAVPGIDGDPLIHALFASGLGDGSVAYYASEHTYPSEVSPNSNEREMFIFNLDALAWGLDARVIESVVAHEFQHMIRDHIQPNVDTWLNEGLSVFTELLLYKTDGAAISFLNAPHTQLNAWNANVGQRSANYGAALLFTAYFAQRYGLEAVQEVSRSAEPRALEAFDHALAARGAPNINAFFADWVLANYIMDPDAEDGRFGYALVSQTLPRPPVQAAAEQYPYVYQGTLAQYATDYLVLRNVAVGDTLRLQLKMPSAAPLIDDAPPNGTRFWYSNRADETVTTLTRAFDLRGLDTAALEYRVWYALEQGWDFGYVLISTDEGLTWEILGAPGMSADYPLSLAYGPAYTGESQGWLPQRIALDPYVGHEVLVRFAVITDDAVSLSGMAIDDVSLAARSYFSDFELDDGGWQSEGWVWVENGVPQNFWVQAVQEVDGRPVINRWEGRQSSVWLLPVIADSGTITIAVSPFAPVTLSPVEYTLAVSKHGAPR
jgi:hypothetical protein